MSRYTLICRMRGPAYLILTGLLALLDQLHILRWEHSWPLYLVLAGVMAIATRNALSQAQQPPNSPGSYAPQPPVAPTPNPGTQIVPGTTRDWSA